MWADGFRETVIQAVEVSREPGTRELAALLRSARADAEEGWFLPFVVGLGRRMVDAAKRLLRLPEAQPNVERVGAAVAKHVKTQTKKVLGARADRLRSQEPTVDAWRRANVQLISKMRDEQLAKIEQLLNNYEGARVEDVAKLLQQEFGVTKSRAELIAVDQTLKLNAQLTKEAHQQAGIDEYYWADVEDGAVRPKHHALGEASRSGKRFRYDDPPVVNEQGDTGNPGDDYRCRCQAIPYVPELEDFETDYRGSADADVEE